MCIFITLKNLSKNADSDSVDFGCDLRFCISNKLSSDAHATGSKTTLWVERAHSSDLLNVLPCSPAPSAEGKGQALSCCHDPRITVCITGPQHTRVREPPGDP